ncbi:unnamed protein product, partial [Ixodes persulcatus]
LTDSEPVVLDNRRVSVTAFAFTLKSVEEIASQLLSSRTASLTVRQGTIDTTADAEDNKKADHVVIFY